MYMKTVAETLEAELIERKNLTGKKWREIIIAGIEACENKIRETRHIVIEEE